MTSAAFKVLLPGSIRMSNGASSLYEKPLPGISSCGDETPKSNRKPSTPGTSAEQSSSSKSPKLPFSSWCGTPGTSRSRRAPAASRAMSSWSTPSKRPVSPTCAAIFTEWPAPPRVQSQTTEPLFNCSDSSTSPSMTGSCRYSCVKIPRSIRYSCLALTRRKGPAGPRRHRPHRP